MEHNEIITDELIAKYMSGKTTKEEDNLIHDYLARNPEIANNLLDIASALRHQRKHDEAAGQIDQEQSQEAKLVPLFRRRSFYYVAASVAVIIGIGLLWFKPFAQNDTEQSLANADTEITHTSPGNNGEGDDLNPTDISTVDFHSEETLLADNQEPNVQPIEIITESQHEQPMLADNSNLQSQQETVVDDVNPDAPIMAAQTIYQDDSSVPHLENAVFVTDSIPSICNPNENLLLQWDCNASDVAIEFSVDGGKVWKLRYTNPRFNQLSLSSFQLNDFKIDNPKGFNWRITAQYRDGRLTREGFIRFTDENN